jgi:membrane-associated phospholipid phosphatase
VETTKTRKPYNSILTSKQVSLVDSPCNGSTKFSIQTQLLWMLVPLALIVAGFATLPVDLPIGHWCVDKNCPAWLENFLTTFEPFGNGIGVAIIGITIFCLDPARRWALPRILACAYLAGLAANGLKMLVERTRPHSFDFHGSVLTTFGNWFPMVSAGSTGQSFPSGHTTTAVALAAVLAWSYPRSKCLFPLMALLVGCQRIESRAHFPSDVLWGAALGSFIALCFLKIGTIPIWFNKMEERLRERLKAEG